MNTRPSHLADAMRVVLALAALAAGGHVTAATPAENFARHCAACHGADRLGGTGPALLPESLERLRKPEAERVIREGRVATQMAPFAGVLPAEEIAALAAWIYTPVSPAPAWSEAQIVASRLEYHAPGSLPARPAAAYGAADMMNLFLVVETGDHHVSILDGDRLEAIHRFPTRYALHGGPKFTADGRYVFFASRDGWISKYDIWNMALVAEIRAGLNTRNVAVSDDGRHVAVANTLPHTIVLLDGDLNLKKVLPVRARDGGASSRVSAVYDAAPRKSFIAALKDVPEVWEISYDEKVEDIPTGVIHDFKYQEGAFIPGYLNPRRTTLSEPLDDFYFSRDYSEVMGASRDAGKGQVVNLDVRRKIADLALPGMPHLGSGIAWTWQGRPVMASPNLRAGVVSVIDMQSWQTVRDIETPGPGFFLRSHEKSRYAFADAMMSREAKDTLVAIDKETLEIAARLRPVPGKTFAHVEFTRDGRYALASLMEQDGALIVIDAQTLKEVKRLPMKKPIGKYNLWNKISRSEGTSH
jgi:mono/diheme cytochrome c family protein/DNA-binding beta-propeller fold protein YncE